MVEEDFKGTDIIYRTLQCQYAPIKGVWPNFLIKEMHTITRYCFPFKLQTLKFCNTKCQCECVEMNTSATLQGEGAREGGAARQGMWMTEVRARQQRSKEGKRDGDTSTEEKTTSSQREWQRKRKKGRREGGRSKDSGFGLGEGARVQPPSYLY